MREGSSKNYRRDEPDWSCLVNPQDVQFQYTWKRARNTSFDLVRPLQLAPSHSPPLTPRSHLALFDYVGTYSCDNLVQTLPRLFRELEQTTKALFDFRIIGVARKEPEELVLECAQFFGFLLQWTQEVCPRLDNCDAVLGQLFEKAFAYSKVLCRLGPEIVEAGEVVEAHKSSTFVGLLFRSSLMQLHLTLKKDHPSFDKREFANEQLVAALQLASDRRWFLSPEYCPAEAGEARAVQPALAWLQDFIIWMQKQKMSDSLWYFFAEACRDPRAARVETAKGAVPAKFENIAWELLSSVLAPMQLRLTDSDVKRCDSCSRDPKAKICGDWTLVKEMIEQDKALDIETKIARIESMLKLWCPDKNATVLIRSLFGPQLNSDVNVKAFLEEGVFLISRERVDLKASGGKFLSALALFRSYILLTDRMSEKRSKQLSSPLYTNMECLIRKNLNESEMKLVVQSFSILLAMATQQGRMLRVCQALDGMCNVLSDEDFAQCNSETHAVVLRAFHIFGALCQDHKHDPEAVFSKLQKWLKIEGMSVRVLSTIDSLLARSTDPRDYARAMPALGMLLKDANPEIVRRAAEVFLYPQAVGSPESLAVCRDLGSQLKGMFQASIKSGGTDAVMLGQTAARLIHLCQSKAGVDLQEFELKSPLAVWTPAQKKVLYMYWAHVLSTNNEFTPAEGQGGGFSKLLQLAPSSPFASSLALPRLLLELLKEESVQLFDLLPAFFSAFASLLDPAKPLLPSPSRSASAGGKMIVESKSSLISELFLHLFGVGKSMQYSEEWIKHLALALGAPGEGMIRWRETVMSQVICPLLGQCQCYKHLAAALLEVVARTYAQGGSSSELAQLPDALKHLLTLPQKKAWERAGLIALRFRVYDMLLRVNHKWPASFCTLVQNSVLREMDETQGGGKQPARISPTPYSGPLGSGDMDWKKIDIKSDADTPASPVTAKQTLSKGISALSHVLDKVPASLVEEFEKFLSVDLYPDLVSLRSRVT